MKIEDTSAQDEVLAPQSSHKKWIISSVSLVLAIVFFYYLTPSVSA